MEIAFENASSDSRRLKDAALLLRRTILACFKDAPEMPWPPSADYLVQSQHQIPVLLKDFLTSIFTTRGKNNQSDRSQRLVLSIGQDICHTVTHGRWKMPKHYVLGMNVSRLGSVQI